MKITLPDDVKKIIETLEENGYEGYAVGGCVRDSILGLLRTLQNRKFGIR